MASQYPAARQTFNVAVDLVQTSCGHAVPFMEHKRKRDVPGEPPE